MNKDEKVCYCFNVTVGDIEKAINEGADSLGAVQQATKAGSGCGRCSANVEKVTTELLKENKIIIYKYPVVKYDGVFIYN